MKINSDVNILGGLPDLEIIVTFLEQENSEEIVSSFTKIKTKKSVERFEKAIKSTFLSFASNHQKIIVRDVLLKEGISNDSLLMLFWNASFNNELFNSINSNVFFPAYYSGRIVLKQGEVSAYLSELKSSEKELQKWSESTIETTASKYLTLLKKLNLLEGGASKSIKHPFLNDKIFILFIYWLIAVESRANILQSPRLQYSFSERDFFIERVLQKKFSKALEVNFTGDKLQIRPLVDYKDIYYVSSQSQSDN